MAITTIPLARMADTFVMKSSNAPRASSDGARFKRQADDGEQGHERGIAMAAPGSVSLMSRRTSAIEPTAPVARAARRSIKRGATQAATCAVVRGDDLGRKESDRARIQSR